MIKLNVNNYSKIVCTVSSDKWGKCIVRPETNSILTKSSIPTEPFTLKLSLIELNFYLKFV